MNTKRERIGQTVSRETMTYLNLIRRWLRLAGLIASAAMAGGADNLAPPSGFEEGFSGWTRWGRDANLITLEAGQAPHGRHAARLQPGHNALYFGCGLSPDQAYALRFSYRLEGENPAGQVTLSFNTKEGGFRSAGFQTWKIEPAGTNAAAWTGFHRVFLPAPIAATCQVSFSAAAGSILWLDDVSLTATEKPAGLVPLPDPWQGMRQRTARPLFRELLGAQPGNYSVVCWTHDLKRTDKSGRPLPGFEDEAQWQREVRKIFQEAGEAGMGFLDLPARLDGADPTRTAAFHAEQSRRYGVKFDVWSEGSASQAAGIKNGAEILNPAAVARGQPPILSWVDPKYVEAQENILRALGKQLRDLPFVGVYYGRDEPTIHLPEGQPEQWGAYGTAMAAQVRQRYGHGKFAAPQPQSPSFQTDPDKPLRWIAYNRWMSDQFIATRKRLYDALHEAHPGARYTAANFWFMSRFVPYDYTGFAACSDLVELDPYASSAEARHAAAVPGKAKLRGRGVFNHGFGAKFMTDLTGKPVRIVVQAFDYAGYAMQPEDLREWVSQAIRCGASAIDYYTLDRPRQTQPERWRMMLHLSRVLTRLNRVQLPDDPDTAILYTLYTHMSHGANTGGDQLYAAHALIGEQAGSWFQFVGDAPLERDEVRLDRYKVVYLPAAKYMTPTATQRIEDYVRAGGVLVCGDPEAFSFDLAGNATRAAQTRILGCNPAGPSSATRVTMSSPAFGLEAGATLPLLETDPYDVAGSCVLAVTDNDAKIVANYPGGTPAIISRRLGQGRVIVFAFNPFAPSVTVEPGAWPAFFKGLQQSLGCRVDRPIWRFVLPPP